MDTELKRLNKGTFKKLVAFFICVLCGALISLQLCSTFAATERNSIQYHHFADAFKNRLLHIDDNEWEYNSFRSIYDDFKYNLADIIGSYGDGSEKTYNRIYEKSIKGEQELSALYKKNIINNFSSDDMMFLGALENGLIEITAETTLESITGSSCSYEINDILNYYEENIHLHDEYSDVSSAVPSSIRDSFKGKDYDGIIYFPVTTEITDIYGSEYVQTIKSYNPGYYAFKVNDELFKSEFEECYKKNTGYTTYAQFKEEYDVRIKDLQNYYGTARYFVRDSVGNTYTNIDSLGKKSTQEEITEHFKGYGTFSYEQNGDTFLYGTDGECYGLGFYDYISSGSVYAEAISDMSTTAITTTTLPPVPETTSFVEQTTVVDYNSVTVPVSAETTSVRITYNSNTVSVIKPYYECYIAVDKAAEEGDCKFANMGYRITLAAHYIRDTVLTCGILFILFAAAFVYLIAVTGKAKHKEGFYLLKADKIPAELKLILNIGIGTATAIGVLSLLEPLVDAVQRSLICFFIACLSAVTFVCLVDLILYFIRQKRNKKLLGCFLIFRISKKIFVKLKGLFKKLSEKTKVLYEKLFYIKNLRKTVFIRTGIIIAINIIVGITGLLLVYESESLGVLLFGALFFFDLYIVYRGLNFVGGVHKLFSLAKEMHNGNLDIHINKDALPPYLMVPAEDMQGLSDGMREAVGEAIKQERTKTELITNVSHDLKTPLTSIINYVDLLKKCDITDETAVSYLNVLSEKSDRLKVLIEDLVEASKASAGAITVNFVSVSLKELINQISGEFEESFEKKNLHLIMDMPVEDIKIKADSKLIYRVLENLFVNIKKYALENTRVYITVSEKGDSGIINLKNISAAPLNITADELKERFVRGEQSRTTEGNGLGLSIAENLCTLQNGSLTIEINGDLFSVTVEMEKVKGYINV